MNKTEFNKIKQKLDSSKNILITGHMRPDGDAVGASMGLYLFFKKSYENVFVMVPDALPDSLNWTPNSKSFIIFDRPKSGAIKTIKKADIIFSLDYNSLSRVGDMGKYIADSDALKVLIDHHPQPQKEKFDILDSDITVSSTSELIYNFLELFGTPELIDKDIASLLYLGIMTDTGSFSFSCDKPETFIVAANLIKHGADSREIHSRVYDSNTENRLRLIGYSIYEKLEVMDEYSTAIMSLTKGEFKKFKSKDGDTEGLVNYGLSIKNINLAVLFTEKNGEIRISMRSKSGFSVNSFAREYFNGGGHERAAGGRSLLSMSETIKKFKSLLPLYSGELNSINE
ncbi:MAG: bifunctional oligoribonuclease/PAP phosphatase NrnA [Bacteroidota bacterium]|nr:bifunctional oligoribonuclease/PAP phosphatase NrnA [Bacteroidota bacterium]